jgi:GT2 family glycosyltransferase
MERTSVIVPTYNRPKGLTRLLDSLDQQIVFPNEVIVIDDSPSQDTENAVNDWIRSHTKNFDLIYRHNDQRMGLGASKNQGVALSRGDLIAFTDDDCIADVHWFEGLSQAIRSAEADIVGAGGIKLPLNVQGPINRYYNATHNPKTRRSLDGCNSLFLKGPFVSVGGFDEVLHPYPEDTALSLKLAMKGMRFTLAPLAVIYHEWPEDLGFFKKKARQGGKGEHAMCDQYLASKLSEEQRHNLERAGWNTNYLRNTPLNLTELAANGIWQMKLWLQNGTPLWEFPSLTRLWYINAVERRRGWDEYRPGPE